MFARITAAVLTLFLLLALSGHTLPEPGARPAALDDPETAKILQGFDDISADAWYAPALAFLCRRGALEASSRFFPNAPMDRSSLSAALCRWAGVPDLGGGAGESLTWAEFLSALHRAAGRAWGENPMAWARGYGLLEQMKPVPAAVVTRAEAFVVLARFWRLQQNL